MVQQLEKDLYVSLLHGWMAAELTDLYRRYVEPAPAGHLLLGGPMWGKKYIERFLAYQAKTIEADLPALRGRARMVLVTDVSGFDLLWQYARRMQANGVPTQILLMPDTLMAQVPKHKNGKYLLLGAVQNLLTQFAGRFGAAYHALFPDILYSEGYFRRLYGLAERHPNIVHTCVSASTSIFEESEKFMRGDVLPIPPVELGDMGWRHLHPQTAANLMNRGTNILGLPPSHCTIWQGKDYLSYHCCHTNAVWMSAAACAKATARYFSPMDCNLPHLLDSFYVPTLQDGMVMVEVSDETKEAIEKRVSPEHFAACCWWHTKFDDSYLPYFRAPNDIPIKPQVEYLERDDIRARHAALTESIIAFKEIVQGRITIEEAA